MKYKIEYILHEKDKETTNSRLYKALDPSTAKEMFNETCSEIIYEYVNNNIALKN
jgi:hypothetical protein